MKKNFFVILLAAALAGAAPASRSDYTAERLNKPAARWELPEVLREVSGIAYLNEQELACVQDELGSIFIYNLAKAAVSREVKFGGPGDYEGIALVGTKAYVLRSDGVIFEIDDIGKQKPAVKKHASVLAATQDAEGLAYDARNNRLLIACKGFDKNLGNRKGIYSFDLKQQKMLPDPVVTIDVKHAAFEVVKKKKPKSDYDALQPSEIAVHPATQQLFLLDAANHRFVVLSRNGEVEQTEALDKNVFRQPEGMDFAPDGTLYIASEGKKGNGTIVKL